MLIQFLKNTLAVLFFILLSCNGYSKDLPEHLKSDVAAVRLKIENEPKLTEKIVKSAWRKLISKYHTDRPENLRSGYTTDDLKLISQRLNEAKNTLLNFLKNNPNGVDQTQFQYTNKQNSTQDQRYSWGAMHDEDSKSVVLRSAYERTVGTYFESIPPEVDVVYFVFEGASLHVGFNTDIVLVFNRAAFPNLEIRYFKKDKDKNPTKVHSETVRYARRYHKSDPPPANDPRLFDVLLRDDESYLLFMSYFSFSLQSVNHGEQKIYFATRAVNSMLTEWKNRYSFGTGNAFSLLDSVEKAQAVMPLQMPLPRNEPPAWLQLTSGSAKPVIHLGHDNNLESQSANLPATPFVAQFNPSLKPTEDQVRAVEQALKLVALGLPSERLKALISNPAVLKNVYFTTNREALQVLQEDKFKSDTQNAFSLDLVNEKNERILGQVILFERLKESATTLDDLMVQIAVAVAHEFTNLYSFTLDTGLSQTRYDFEIEAFSGSIQFIEDLLNKNILTKYFNAERVNQLHKLLTQQLNAEVRGLTSWQKAKEKYLKSTNNSQANECSGAIK